MNELISPHKLFSRSSVLDKQCPVPKSRGLYAWFFKEIPPFVPTDGCIKKDNLNLLYVGISPKDKNSTQDLRKRIKTHFNGNAEGSTLRLTLGVLLENKSGFALRRVGSWKRLTFTHIGEQWLDNWMEQNAYVCWEEHQKPWKVEESIFQSVSLPLNIRDNTHNPFSQDLSKLRTLAKQRARCLPIANEDNQQRQMKKEE
jgi:hypothetical protein